jgi:hypothetical protein
MCGNTEILGKGRVENFGFQFSLLFIPESRSAAVEDEIKILLAVMLEHSVGTDERQAFRNGLRNDEAVGRVVMPGDEIQMRKGVEVLFLYVLNRDIPFILDVMKNVFRRFPFFHFNPFVLEQVNGFLYALGTDVNHVFVVLKNVKNIMVQRLKIVGSIEYEYVRINKVSHTDYFITARMSMIFNIPFGFCLLHSPILDSLLGGTYGVSSLLALAFLGVAGFVAFVVMTVQFYSLRMQRYNIPGFSQKILPSHAAYFITARMSMIFNIPSGFSRLHKAAFDSFLGGTYRLLSFQALAFRGVAGFVVFDAFVVMTVQFYSLRMQRYNFPGFSQSMFYESTE